MGTANNRDFQTAKAAKKDEFYTQLVDIEREIDLYAEHFRDKVVYLNCDDPRVSNFFRYFAENFERLGLKKLVSTCYRSEDAVSFGTGDSERAVWLEYTGDKDGNRVPDADEIGINLLQGDGDFRSEESVDLLKEADIIVTNPPFSLFREYMAQLFEYDKQFLILGNMNAVTYAEIFALFQSNRVWYGHSIRSGDREFGVPADYPLTAAGSRIDENGNKFVRVKGVRWFTNLDHPVRHHDLELTETYEPSRYPKFANFDAINVNKTALIPSDYPGLMGVPISFMDKFSPEQFEIIGSSRTLGVPIASIAPKGSFQPGGPRFYLDNGDGTYRRMYDRIVIRNRRLQVE